MLARRGEGGFTAANVAAAARGAGDAARVVVDALRAQVAELEEIVAVKHRRLGEVRDQVAKARAALAPLVAWPGGVRRGDPTPDERIAAALAALTDDTPAPKPPPGDRTAFWRAVDAYAVARGAGPLPAAEEAVAALYVTRVVVEEAVDEVLLEALVASLTPEQQDRLAEALASKMEESHAEVMSRAIGEAVTLARPLIKQLLRKIPAPPCAACATIQAADSSRHFRGCPGARAFSRAARPRGGLHHHVGPLLRASLGGAVPGTSPVVAYWGASCRGDTGCPRGCARESGACGLRLPRLRGFCCRRLCGLRQAPPAASGSRGGVAHAGGLQPHCPALR